MRRIVQQLLGPGGAVVTFTDLVNAPDTHVNLAPLASLGLRGPVVYKAAAAAVTAKINLAWPLSKRVSGGRILQTVKASAAAIPFGARNTASNMTCGKVRVSDGTTTLDLTDPNTVSVSTLGIPGQSVGADVDAGSLDPALDWNVTVDVGFTVSSTDLVGIAVVSLLLETQWTYIRPQA